MQQDLFIYFYFLELRNSKMTNLDLSAKEAKMLPSLCLERNGTGYAIMLPLLCIIFMGQLSISLPCAFGL